jgi:hypothetical protein
LAQASWLFLSRGYSILLLLLSYYIQYSEPKVKDESVLDLIPPCNRETKDVNKVYNLSDILTEEELNDMDELAEQFLNVTEEEINAWRLAKKYMSFYQYHCYSVWQRNCNHEHRRLQNKSDEATK